MFTGRRVLVVEDEFLVSLATADILETLGCVVVGPSDQLEPALRLARTENLDAAVLDVNLSSEMVWPVADELYRRNIPFLFLSAYRHIGQAPAHISTAPFLGKPLDESRLRRTLTSLWND